MEVDYMKKRICKIIAMLMTVIMITGILPTGSITFGADGDSIATHEIKWISGSSTTTIDGNNLVITPSSNGSNSSYVKCQVNFTLGDLGWEDDLEKGDVEIRLPRYIFYDRDGNGVGTVTVPLAQQPLEQGDTGFNYYIDEDTDEIVLVNYNTIDCTYHFNCQIQYNFTPYNVSNGYSNSDIKASFNVKTTHEQLSASSDNLSVKVNTSLGSVYASKSVTQKYETWQSDWGTAPADASDYFYLKYYLYTRVYPGTEPYSLKLQENIGDYGEIVGYQSGSATSTFVACTQKEFEDKVFATRASTYTYSSTNYVYTYVVVKYPRSMLDDSGTAKISNTYKAVTEGLDGDTMEQSSSVNYTYQPVNLEYTGDLLNTSKSNSDYYNYGGINAIEKSGYYKDNDYYSISVDYRGWSKTENGTKNYSTVLEDNLMYINSTDNKLEPEDYCFSNFGITSLNEYGYEINDDTGYTAVLSSQYEDYNNIEVYVKTLDNKEWTKYGEIKKTGQYKYQWTSTEGETKELTNYSNSVVDLPKDTYDVRFVHTGKQYRVSYTMRLCVQYNYTEHMKNILDNVSSYANFYNYCSAYGLDSEGKNTCSDSNISNSTFLKTNDVEKYGCNVAHAYTYRTYYRISAASSCKKSAKTSSDITNSREKIEYTINMYEYPRYYSDAYTISEIQKLGLYKQQKNGIFYDLLPPGVVVDTSTMSVVTYEAYKDSSTGKNSRITCEYNVELQEDWRGSGRTMMIINVSLPEEYKDIVQENSGFTITYTAYDSWINIMDYGTTVRNSVAYYSLSGELASGRADDGGSITDKTYFVDLDEDGNEDSIKNVMYAQVSSTLNSLTASELGFRKAVKSAEDLSYSSTTNVAAGGDYTYRLRFANEENSTLSDAIMYDILENGYGENQYWRGKLKSIDLTQIKNKGIAPVVYYSTSENIRSMAKDDFKDLTNETLWTTTKPEDDSKITAVAIDMRYKTDGSAYTFQEGEAAVCYLHMQAPLNWSDYTDNPDTEEDETIYAYNTAFIKGTATAALSHVSTDMFEECREVTVSLRREQIAIHKTSNPATGTEQQPTIVKGDNSLDYTLSITNSEQAQAFEKVKIEDTIPEGLIIDTDNIKYWFGDNQSSATLLKDGKRLSLETSNRKLSFIVDKLAAGETLNILIPTKVDDSITDAEIFKNTAYITEIDGDACKLESETTYHKKPKKVTEMDFEFIKTDETGAAFGENDAQFKLYSCTHQHNEDCGGVEDATKCTHTHSSLVSEDEGNCWGELATANTDKDGKIVFEKLPAGYYMLVETKTKDGYQLPTGQWLIQIDTENVTYNITACGETPPAFKVETVGSGDAQTQVLKLPNYKKLTLAMSGAGGTIIFVVIGIVLIGISFMLMSTKKRKKA
jgi:hypothetical protein